MRGLVAALVLGGLAVLVLYGDLAWRSTAAILPASNGMTDTWLLPTLACVALTWAFDAARHARRDP